MHHASDVNLFLTISSTIAGSCGAVAAIEDIELHGRIGDSHIIGAGLYADNEVGAYALHPGFVYAMHEATPDTGLTPV